MVGVLFVALLAGLIFAVFEQPLTRTLQVGAPSPRTFTAPIELQVVDRLATEARRQAAAAQVPELLSLDTAGAERVLGAIESLDAPAALSLRLRDAYTQPGGVAASMLPQLRADALTLVRPDDIDAMAGRLDALLIATALPDPRLTEAARSAAAAAVPQVFRALAAGELVVREGDTITGEVLATLEAAGLYAQRSERLTQSIWVGLGALALALMAGLPMIMWIQAWRERYTEAQVLALLVLTLVGVGLQRLSFELFPNVVWVLVVPLLIAVIAGQSSGFFWAAWVAVLTAVLAPATPMLVLLVTLILGLVAVVSVRDLSVRASMVTAGALAGLAGGSAWLAWVLVAGGATTTAALVAIASLIAGGVLAGILALGLLPLFETAGGFLTNFRLMELSSPSHPLLQRLLLEAPGSYQHSLIISNLVETAVRAIGGNPLLARVGSLYHDVGKMRRPQFFVENQFGSDNPHDRISPHLSYLIITSHIRDGLELLRQYRLPSELDPFVLEHHGTTVLAYFYKRALDDTDAVSDLNFRYPGPRPRSKETAVLMLADAVESASRTLTDPTQGSIRALIDRLIEQRLQDEQLSLSPLNLHDLEVIAGTFERMLAAVLHRRIQYPSVDEVRGVKRDDRLAGRDTALPVAP